MNYLVRVYYAKERLLANIQFELFSEAEDFFAQQVQDSTQEPVELWLKLKAGVSEEYLLNHYRLN